MNVLLAITAQPPLPLLLSSPVPGACTSHREEDFIGQTVAPVNQVRVRDSEISLCHPDHIRPTLPYSVCLCSRPGSNETQEYFRRLALKGDTQALHLRATLLFFLGSYCLLPGLVTLSGFCFKKLALKGGTQSPYFHLRINLLFSLGSYCLLPGLVTPSGFCSAGFFCNHGASVPNPTDGITGDLCPSGHFCPRGSPHPVPCGPGRSLECEVCCRPLEELRPSLRGLWGKDTEETLQEAEASQHRSSVVYVWLVGMSPRVIQCMAEHLNGGGRDG